MNFSVRIGVVIPVWNAKDDLDRTLSALSSLPESIRASLVVSIADGGSSDGTLDVIAAYPSLVDHISSQSDAGVYDAMNRGAAALNTPWLWFLGAGDLPCAEGLMTLLQRLEHATGSEAHAGAVTALEPREPGVPARFHPSWGASLTWRNTVHHQGLVAPASWLQETSFDPQWKVLADYAWLLDQRNLARHVVCHPDLSLCEVPGGGLSRSFTPSLYWEEWRMKRTRMGVGALLVQAVWLPLKWAFKQVSKAFKI